MSEDPAKTSVPAQETPAVQTAKFKTIIETDSNTRLLDLYTAYRLYLNHEHGLINHRLTWNFTIQGFLFTSYAFVLNKAADVRIALSQKVTEGVGQLLIALHDLEILLLVIGAVGIIASIAVQLSVWGAILSMNSLKQRWHKLGFDEHRSLEQVGSSRGYPDIMGGGSPPATVLGFLAPIILSIALIAAWALLIADVARQKP
jgi:hypothetical protein